MINREQCGLHHPGNIAPVCNLCNKRRKSTKGRRLSWEEHLRMVCSSNGEVDKFEERRHRIHLHMTEGEFAYPKLTENEMHTIREMAESLYMRITLEIENELERYKKFREEHT